MKLTARQEQILELIRACIAESGMPPTRSEISQALGFSSANAAEEHLRALAKKGVIELLPGASRGIRIIDRRAEDYGLAVIGRVAAGSPILAAQNIERHCSILPDFFQPRADYLLRVKGMSMKDVGILEDDLLAVHQTKEVRTGIIVVARLGDEVTVKRFFKKHHTVQLVAENPDFPPIVVDLKKQEFEIEGIAVGVIRNNGVLR